MKTNHQRGFVDDQSTFRHRGQFIGGRRTHRSLPDRPEALVSYAEQLENLPERPARIGNRTSTLRPRVGRVPSP